jgi:glycosyltransferase involved in cell wall biosynthesis
MKKLVNVIVSAYNEEDCIDELCARLAKVFDGESQYRFKAYIIENGSIDSTWEKLSRIVSGDNRFAAIKLARNFRMDGGLTAGLSLVDGDACVLMAADLQDPPEMIPTFIRQWESGWENVYGVVTKRTGTKLLRKINSALFYKLAGFLTDGKIPKNASDFRLVDRRVYVAVREMHERNRFVRGLFGWVGFKSVGVPMVRPDRYGGISNAKTSVVLDLAFKGIFAHSHKPLRLITIMGLAISALAFLAVPILAVIWFTLGVPFAGFGSLISIILLAFGVQIVLIGILSEYVGLIYEEVKGRPNFIISESNGV